MSSGALVLDYGMGNVLSVMRALEHCGGKPELSNDPKTVAKADRVVVPGVGAFADCMAALNSFGLVESIMGFVASGRPLLGICVGMQILFEAGEEFGDHRGIGLLPGRVVKLIPQAADGSFGKIPHIGWSPVAPPEGTGEGWWRGSVFARTSPHTSFYFVHSYTARPHQANLLAEAHYCGASVTAAVKSGNVTGVQFHPEKSGEAGLLILKNFLRS
jgi:glutamine amidotransferase